MGRTLLMHMKNLESDSAATQKHWEINYLIYCLPLNMDLSHFNQTLYCYNSCILLSGVLISTFIIKSLSGDFFSLVLYPDNQCLHQKLIPMPNEITEQIYYSITLSY